jgi:UDP-N-acetylglucosamine--dolichyl-phosphate N-acetylglucosaminephosphotransferase
MELLGISVLLGLLTTLLGGPYARKYLLSSGIYGIDQQKKSRPKVATSGGILVLFGFIVSITAYLGLAEFYSTISINVSLVLAALSSINIIALIGLLDDIHVKSEDIETSETPTERLWDSITNKFGSEVDSSGDDLMDRAGLGQMSKMLFVLPAALPLITVGAGSWSMNFPVIGTIHWGIIYPLVLLPLGLLFVSNVINMLAGTNGLSAGVSLVAALGLGTFAIMNSKIEAALIAFGLAAALLGFLKYNWYPASILPGDSLTYLCGAGLFSAMVIGNMEKFGVFIFAPWFLEFFLKLRSGFKAHSWGILENGKLKPQHSKNYSLTHPLMRRGLNEKQITVALISLEVLVVISGLLVFYLGIL